MGAPLRRILNDTKEQGELMKFLKTEFAEELLDCYRAIHAYKEMFKKDTYDDDVKEEEDGVPYKEEEGTEDDVGKENPVFMVLATPPPPLPVGKENPVAPSPAAPPPPIENPAAKGLLDAPPPPPACGFECNLCRMSTNLGPKMHTYATFERFDVHP